MKFTKITALLMCILLIIVTFSACTQSETPEEISESPPQSETESPSPSESEPPLTSEIPVGSFDFDSAYASLPPETVIMTAGDYEVKWDEFFFYLCSSIAYLESNEGFEFSAEAYSGTTYEDLILSYAQEDALSYKAVRYGTNQLGVTLGADERAEIESDLNEAIATNGGEEALLQLLKSNSYIHNLELFEYLLETDFLVSLCYEQMFGENFSKLTDEMAAEKVQSGGYLMAKHILRLKTEDGDTTPLEEAEEILEKLNNYSGNDFDGYFTELMLDNSEDTGGLSSYPDGYLFQYGDMVTEFYEACVALEIGGFSGIVETTYGYHILYRMPLDFNAVPFAYYSAGYNTTLRQVAASEIFNSMIAGWIYELNVEYTDEYESLSLEDIFTRR